MRHLITLILSLTSLLCNAEHENKIVRIYGMVDSKNAKVGTGFFFKNSNGQIQVATCYHVVANTTPRIYSSKEELKNIKLEGYDAARDIAIISFTSSIPVTEAFIISDINTNLTSLSVKTIAHPNGIQFQEIKADITYDKLLSSKNIFNSEGKPIFKLGLDLNLINLNLTIYGGMSGAPLIYNNKVIGIISGSINTGGSLAWSIPSIYLIKCKSLYFPISNFKTLAEYNGLEPGNRFLIRNAVIREFEKLDEIVKEFDNKSSLFYETIIQLSKLSAEYLAQTKNFTKDLENISKNDNDNSDTMEFIIEQIEDLDIAILELEEELSNLKYVETLDSLGIDWAISFIKENISDSNIRYFDEAISSILGSSNYFNSVVIILDDKNGKLEENYFEWAEKRDTILEKWEKERNKFELEKYIETSYRIITIKEEYWGNLNLMASHLSNLFQEIFRFFSTRHELMDRK